MTGRRGSCTWDAISNHIVMSALAMSAVAGCTATAQAETPRADGGLTTHGRSDRRGAPSASDVRGTPSPPDRSNKLGAPAAADERGIYIDVQPGQLGFDHSLQVRRSATGVPHELRDGDKLISGDRIRVTVQTSVDAYLYLAFCSHHGITLYPAQGGIRTRAGVLMIAPPGGGELVIDDEPGSEVLYVVVSTSELSVADPRLAAALATTRPGNTAQDCGPALDASLRSPPGPAPTDTPPAPHPQIAPTSNVIRGQPIARRPMPPRAKPQAPSTSMTAGVARSATLIDAQDSGRAVPGSAPPGGEPPKVPDIAPPPDPDFVRSPGNTVWHRRKDTRRRAAVVAADPAGIALVRHTFTHVAHASP